MRVVFSRYFIDSDISYLKSRVQNVEFVMPVDFSDEGLLAACVRGVDVFLGPPPSEAVLNSVSEQLRFIQIPWAGVDQVDFSACRKLNITCLNSHSNAEGVAELAIGLAFSLLKQIPFHDAELKKGKWHRPSDPEGFFPPLMLSGMTIGYFGFGGINQKIRTMLSGFGLNHLACVTSFREIAGVKVFNFSEVEDFVSLCDIIFIGAPLTDRTNDLFDENLLFKVKKGAYLINVSRAQIVNERALSKALNINLSGAAMDVWYKYPNRGESRSLPCSKDLLACNNLIVSPHRAGYLKDELPHLNDAIDNINIALNGGVLKNVINLLEKY